MEIIYIPDNLIKKAQNYKIFRQNLKKILARHDQNYDKFTVTENDCVLGYISESLVSAYLKLNNIPIITWEDETTLSNSLKLKVINNPDDNFSDVEIRNLKNYFYDKWDLKYGNLTIDVKTAATCYDPKDEWTFAFPVIQANKPGKTHCILTYIQYAEDPKYNSDEPPKKLYIWGYMSIDKVKKYPTSDKNIYKGYNYQILNHITKLKDYNKDIISLFNKELRHKIDSL